MNRKIYLITTLVLFLAFLLYFPAGAQAAEKSLTGNGSAGNPYQITSAADLMTFRDLVNNGDYDAYGTVTSDIVLGANWTPIGGHTKATAYAGLFAGNDHTITFSTIENTEEFQGLFACNTGTIQNLTVKGSLSGSDYVGAIAAVNRGTIQNCHNIATISVNSAIGFAGGITGVNYGAIQNVTNDGKISSAASGSCIGGIVGAAREGTIQNAFNSSAIALDPVSPSQDYNEGCAGGIAGLNYAATIATSGNTGTVSNEDGSGYTGGIAGLNNGTIEHCYNASSITGTYYAGGITGYNFLNEEAGEATLHNTLNVGSITENTYGYGSTCGVNTDGHIYDNYYKEGTAAAGIGSSNDNGATSKSEQELASGEVAYLLNGNQSSNPTWYQTLTEDAYPLLDSTHKVVYRHRDEDGTITYTNHSDQHTDHEFGEDGTCDICGYQSVKLLGHNMTLDGVIGVNYYYYIDPMYYQDDSYQIQVDFSINGRTETAAFDVDKILYTGDPTMPQAYGFRLNIRSDEMTSAIVDTLKITKGEKTVVSLSQSAGTYRVYDYVKKQYSSSSTSKEIKDLMQGLATYDYYANEYYNHFAHYEPEIPLLSLDSVTAESLASYQQTTADETNYSAKYYGSSLNLLSETAMSFFISSTDTLDVDTLYLGYKTHGSAEDYTYTKAKKYNSYYQGTTKPVPASELNIMWDVAFFIKQENGTYQQITAQKTAGPLSYIEGILRTSTKESMCNLAKSLYLYHQTTNAYFKSLQ